MGGRGKKKKQEQGTGGAGAVNAISTPAASFWLFPAERFPRSLHQLQSGGVRQVRCGLGWLALVQKDGSAALYETEDAQERQNQSRKPRHVTLRKTKIRSLDFGGSQMLLLSADGKLFEHITNSRPMRILHDRQIVQVACGDRHSMALSKAGELFAWGENTHGQLGIQGPLSPQCSPLLVGHLRGSPLAQISAGSAHSFALSLSGAVYSWGKNNRGQLGLGHTKDQHVPTFVESLKHKKSESIACGEDHTAVLTKDGLVFTFGAGGHGQLGHNCTRDELYPRLVAELFGVRISQVACGRNHTLTYAPSLEKVYSFGAGEQGQLGNGQKCKQLIPLPMELPGQCIHPKSSNSGKSCMYKIAAGGNQSVVFCVEKKNEDRNTKTMIATVDIDMAEKWLANWNTENWQQTKKTIKLIFSSMACINGSFLEQSKYKHFRTSAKMSGVDMPSVYLFFEKIAKNDQVLQQVETAIQKLLLSLPSCPITAEVYRVYLIIPELFRVLKLQHDSEPPISLFAKAILRLSAEKLQILESMWSELPTAFFMALVNIFQKASSYYLHQALAVPSNDTVIDDMMRTLSVLSILYKVNSSAGFKIQESNFYIPKMVRLWTFSIDELPRCFTSLPILQKLTAFPCIFDMQSKIKVHEMEGRIGQAFSIQYNYPSNILSVRRKQLVQDTWKHLRIGGQAQMCHSVLEVHFMGEPGIDRGGLSQEFFTVITRELCDPKAKVFRHFEESCSVWFPNEDPTAEDTFFLTGIIMGMALYNNCVANFPFPLALYKKLLNVEPTLEDLRGLSPTEGRTLQALLEEKYDENIESLFLDFTIVVEEKGSLVCKELVKNGSHIPVLKYNRKKYVDAYVKYVFTTSVEKHFQNFFKGFVTGCPITTWKLFLPVELMALIHGNTEYDWEKLEKNTVYHGYEATDEVIKNFWNFFHELLEEEKKHFLAFVTGSDRIPVGGMDVLILVISESHCEDADLYYPSAATCSHVLHLPRYSNMQTLKEMFLFALQSFETFGTA